jgi:hypothetical protein
MLVSQLIKSTLDIQGFRVSQVQGDTNKIIVVDIVPDRCHLLLLQLLWKRFQLS